MYSRMCLSIFLLCLHNNISIDLVTNIQSTMKSSMIAIVNSKNSQLDRYAKRFVDHSSVQRFVMTASPVRDGIGIKYFYLITCLFYNLNTNIKCHNFAGRTPLVSVVQEYRKLQVKGKLKCLISVQLNCGYLICSKTVYDNLIEYPATK